METVKQLYEEVRENFSGIAGKTDQEHIRVFSELEPEQPYSWFGSLANALNREMCNGVEFKVHAPVFSFMEHACGRSPEVHRCIDVAFVENLFCQVPSRKCFPYWSKLPSKLKALYVAFHHREP